MMKSADIVTRCTLIRTTFLAYYFARVSLPV